MKSNEPNLWYQQSLDVITLTLHIQLGAKRTEILGHYGDALKIRLASPPIDGRANEVLLKFMAELFHVPLRQVELKRGEKSRRKIILIKGSNIDPSCIFKQ